MHTTAASIDRTGFTPYQLAFDRLPQNPCDRSRTKFKFSRPNDYWDQLPKFKHYVNEMGVPIFSINSCWLLHDSLSSDI
ncbi:unnamed protein product, partial [Didymodactylos carnosus]